MKWSDLTQLPSDIIPDKDNVRELGSDDRAWKDIYAHYGYFLNDAYVQGKKVLKDGDPVITYMFIEQAKQDIDNIYNTLLDVKQTVDLLKLYTQNIYAWTRPAIDLETLRLEVGTTPVPLSNVDRIVKRIHIKVPSWSPYLVYVGNESRQDFVLEPGDKETFEIENPRKIFVRSLGNVTVFIAFEV